MKQVEYIGVGSINNLCIIIKKYSPNNIFLITGKSSYIKSGAKSKLDKILSGHKTTYFNDFELNIKLPEIERGVSILKKNNCDFIIAVGGGSVIDAAKLINILAANSGELLDYVKNEKKIKHKGKPLVAIPMTTGSGSEATHFAVIYNNKTKYSLTHKYILPNYAIVDAQLTMSLSVYQTASTGMDALGQAMESYWCIYSTEKSKKYSEEAIQLAIKHLYGAVNNPTIESREAMMKAAHLAGKAINITKTTAAHAISYPLTSYFNIPHGHAVGLTLAQMLVYNFNVTKEDLLDTRGIGYVKSTINEIVNLLGARTVEDASEKIKNLMDKIGLERRLSKLGIRTDKDIEIVIREGFNPDRVKNNPRKLTEDALRKILQEVY